ncbi:spermidine synthase [Ktedonospora formicarum]|uniref:Spermidine synthase n=1 Tax=Ktedonospora formicarum TaxID=2778364 RepID=A0A8J3HWT9_9CHLR|nr:fused MFS/spermidine synthase [Ktedonospora formicarum]GHO42480.1 spermidine synthase [Ktedonospora formicarum]
MKKLLFIILVFISGMTSLGLEMCASRLLGAYFGSSLYIWAVLIGLVLIYLTVGYFIGGRLADRYPSAQVLCVITAAAALTTAMIPFISQSVLSWSVSAIAQISVSAFLASLLGTVLLFAVPVTLLGLVSPFAIRLVTSDVKQSGRISGSLYAISTCGSILGSFLPVLWLIPTFGVRRSLLIFATLLFAASLWGLWQIQKSRLLWRPLTAIVQIALIATLFMELGPLKQIPDLIYHQESLYNYIQVTQQADGTRSLILNEGQAIHSIAYADKNRVLTGWYWDYFLAAPYFNKGFTPDKLHRVAIVGLAGGTIAHQFTQVYGPVPIDGVEIDPAIVDVGRKYFGMTEPNLNVHVQDGRPYIATTQEQFDEVVIDAFQQPYIPFQLTTKEFFNQVRARLSPQGVVALNTGHTSTDYRLVQSMVATMSKVFPSVYVLNVPNTFNTVVMATMQPTTIETFRSQLSQLDPTTTMGQVANEVVPVVEIGRPKDGIVFTDDRAPIEQITDQLLLSYIYG